MIFFRYGGDGMNNNNKQNRTQIVKARVTENEKCLIESKAKHYGYRNVSKYLIDAAIYEKVTYVNIKNEEKIINALAENSKQLKKILKDVNKISRFATQINEITINQLLMLMIKITNEQKKIQKLIDEKLDLDVWQKIKQKEEIRRR